MRKSAAILTRCACLLASDGLLKSGTFARNLTMSGLIRRVRAELFPDPRRKVRDGEPTEQAWAFAHALIAQDPIDKSPKVRDLVDAARKLRRMADAEEHPMPTAAELRAAERRIGSPGTRPFEFSDKVSIAARRGGYRAWVLHFNGSTHEVIESDSLDGLVGACEAAKRDSGDPAAVLRKEAARLGFTLVERGAA